MVRIRLRRAGGKGQPTHRIVAADKESPRDGRFIEILGDYNPRTEPATIRLKEDRIYHWLSVGAQPSKAVKQVFGVVGLMERYQRYQEGEDLETLLEEAKELEKQRHVDPRTRRDEQVGKPKPKAEKPVAKSEKAEEVEEEPAEVEEEEVKEEDDDQEVEEADEVEDEEVDEEEDEDEEDEEDEEDDEDDEDDDE